MINKGFTCPNCGHEMELHEDNLVKQFTCPVCLTLLTAAENLNTPNMVPSSKVPRIKKHLIVNLLLMYVAIFIASAALVLILQSNSEVNHVTGQIDELQRELLAQKDRVGWINLELDLLKNNKLSTAILDPRTPGQYARLDSDSGHFFAILKDVEPYLDGVKVFIVIGNPTSATYNGFKLTAKWGEKFDITEKLILSLPPPPPPPVKEKPSIFDDLIPVETRQSQDLTSLYSVWKSALSEKEISFTQALLPGYWNKIDFVLSPINLEEFGYLELSIETDELSLLTQRG